MPLVFLCRLLVLLSVSGLIGTAVAQSFSGADPVGLRGDFSGSWYPPEQSGHGLFIEVLDDGRAVLAWYTFDPSGQPAWLYGAIDVEGARLTGELFVVEGGRFPPMFDPAQVQSQPWGTIVFEATGCDAAELSWQAIEPGYGSGNLALQRLTRLHGQRCNIEESFAETRQHHFERGPHRFTPLFVDLPASGQDIYELDFAYEALPPPLSARRGLRLTGHNRSDDLAMLVTAPIGGLLPDQRYQLEIELELASNVPTGCVGIGGSPGDSVYLKLGAVNQRPQAVTVDEGGFATLRANVDIGSQAQGGETVQVVGTLANRQTCEDLSQAEWQLKTVRTGQPLSVSSDSDGQLWLLAGTDSAFEGLTVVYLTSLRVRLEPVMSE